MYVEREQIRAYVCASVCGRTSRVLPVQNVNLIYSDLPIQRCSCHIMYAGVCVRSRV